jgi:hypothetical protein
MNRMVSVTRLRPFGWGALLALHLALLLASPAAAEGAATEGAGAAEAWETLSADGFTIDHRKDDALYASRVLSIHRARGAEIARSMGLPSLTPLHVVIASSNEEFAREASAGVPDWGVGCAFPRRGLIVLKSPRIVNYPLQMEAVVVHEMAHVAAGRALGRVDAPQWFHEGIAMSVAGEWRLEQSPSLASAAAAGGLIPLSALERGFPGGSDAAALAYAESFRAVRFLMDETGIAAPGDLVRLIATEGDFDRALMAMYGGTRAEFERDLFDFFGRRFRWGLILRDGRLLFSVATGLFLIALVIRLRRSRRRMREWDEEERFRTGGRPPRRSDTSWN